MWVRVTFLTIFALFIVHKAAVLTASLPFHAPRPRNRLARMVFVRDRFSLTMHLAEAFAGFSLIGMWWLLDPWERLPYLIPCVIALLVPFGKLCIQNASIVCLKRSFILVMLLLASPFVILYLLVLVLRKYPHRLVHPLDGGVHIITACSVIPIALICHSNMSIVLIWAIHSVLLFLGVIEIFFVRKFQWREGPPWWFALQTSGLGWYTANVLCEFKEGFGKPDYTNFIVFATSSVWILLVCLLGVKVNWRLCVHYYQTWQTRHGRFTLNADQPGGDAAAVAPAAQASTGTDNV